MWPTEVVKKLKMGHTPAPINSKAGCLSIPGYFGMWISGQHLDGIPSLLGDCCTKNSDYYSYLKSGRVTALQAAISGSILGNL